MDAAFTAVLTPTSFKLASPWSPSQPCSVQLMLRYLEKERCDHVQALTAAASKGLSYLTDKSMAFARGMP